MRRIAVYPGSFDPITYGHVDIIRRLQPLYDELVILVAQSTRKSYLFSADERAQLVRECLNGLPSVRVDVFDGLTVEYARNAGASTIIRGLRAISDYEYEHAMADMNRKLAPDIETLVVFTRPEFSYVSSRMVKEVAHYGGALEDIVPPQVAQALTNKISQPKK